MNNSKYFVPNTEDLHVGYECEINSSAAYQDEYTPIKIGFKDGEGVYTEGLSDLVIMMDDGYGKVRTPYLTKEQIEAEGWRLNEDKRYAYCFEKHFHYNTYYLSFTPKTEQYKELLMISHFVEGDHEFMYKGTCPSINEFRKITSLLEFE